MIFGPDGFFGYSPQDSKDAESGGQYMWWSTFEAETPPSRDMLLSEIKDELLNRHGDWVSPQGDKVVKDIIEHAVRFEEERPEEARKGILVLPNYRMPKI